MTSTLLHPGLLIIACGVALGFLRGSMRSALALGVPLAAIWLVLAAPEGVAWRATYLGLDVAPFAVDRLSRLFALIFSIMVFGGALFALRQPSRLELPAAFVYAGLGIPRTVFPRRYETVA